MESPGDPSTSSLGSEQCAFCISWLRRSSIAIGRHSNHRNWAPILVIFSEDHDLSHWSARVFFFPALFFIQLQKFSEFCRSRHRQVCGLGFSAGHVVTTHATPKKCYIRIRWYLGFTEGNLICLCFGRGAFLLLCLGQMTASRVSFCCEALRVFVLSLKSNFLKLMYVFLFSFLIFCLCFPRINYLRTADGCKQAGTAIMEGVPAPSPSAALKDEGNTNFKAGNFLKAAALYTQAIKKDPENAALYRSSLLSSCASQLLKLILFLC